MKVSAIVLTKNEEGNIQRCLTSLDFCDEIVIIDDYSNDRTGQIVKKFGAKIINRKLNGDFASQRNFGLKSAKNEWVLFIDADEVVSEALKNEILKTIDKSDIFAGFLSRRDYIFGKLLKYGEAGNIKIIRLVKKGSGKFTRKVHEVFVTKKPTITLKNYLLHYPHPTLRSFIASIDYTSDIHARENLKGGKKSSVLKIIFWPIFKFINNYIFKLGLLDGMQGFIIGFMMSLHSFLSWSKLWVIQQKKE